MARVSHPEHVQDELVAAYVAGLSFAAVADQFGVSPKFVAKLTKQRGVARENDYNRLPDDFRDRVAEMLPTGMSAAQIGAALGVSKGSIIGLVSRDERLKAIGFASSPGPRGPRKAKDKLADQIADQPEVKRVTLPTLKAEAIAYDATAQLVSLVERGHDDCCFPVGDPKDEAFGFCGHTRREGSAYCDHHHRRMFKAEAA